MKVTINYFGMITDITKRDQEAMETSVDTISELVGQLETNYPDLKHKNFQIAQGGRIVDKQNNLSGEEIALLPPFAGG